MDGFINALARAQDKNQNTQGQLSPMMTSAEIEFEEHVLPLSAATLKSRRVVSFDASDKATRAFDVMRNMCTRDLRPRMVDRPVFGVSSPTLGCGSSTTAANLAFSLARAQAGKVVLADFAPMGESWWHLFGLDAQETGLKFRHEAIYALDVRGTAIRATSLLPVVIGKSGAELKRALNEWIDQVRRALGPVSIVLDLPPLLNDDRVATLVAELDLMLLVLAAGRSTMAEVETCKTYLHDASSVQLVLNKARDYDF